MKPRRIGVFTAARSEYSLLRWIIKEIHEHKDFELLLYVSGAHFSSDKGYTVVDIIEDGIKNFIKIECMLDSKTPTGLSKTLGLGIISLSQVFEDKKPDIMIILGDRHELLIPVSVCLMNNIPIVHIAGGEITEGVIDELVRHATTKFSHIHLVQTEVYAENISKMGEEDYRIAVIGAPGIENIKRIPLMDEMEIREKIGIDVKHPTVLCTYHPTTLEMKYSVLSQIEELLQALNCYPDLQVVFTAPGVEVGSAEIEAEIMEYIENKKNAHYFKNLGSRLYLSLMKYSLFVIGNSSSGIIEAPSLGVPTVNIGDRQKGRVLAQSVINCSYYREDIVKAIHKALSNDFQKLAKKCRNPYDPYGDGMVSRRVIKILENVEIDENLMRKRLIFEVKKHEWNTLLKNK